ncbi:hypothetical protein AVEN_35932-1 [Araneus ventricosus]|uniref:Uncharacterized protein n=1 Tax=Araneus ventricosus TaxID=182803 RepID=A0A4Y1ZQ63_ARAVE|nr:hypothetical protein AVEN_35932-1 [Araneus ventricosus]
MPPCLLPLQVPKRINGHGKPVRQVSVSEMADFVTVKVTPDWFEFPLLTIFRLHRLRFQAGRIESTISVILSDRSRATNFFAEWHCAHAQDNTVR